MPYRRLLPTSRRDRSEVYEVTDDEGVVRGQIRAWTAPRGRRFYSDSAPDPDVDSRVDLGSSTDLDERAAKILEFTTHPERFNQHRLHIRSHHVDDPNRIVHGPGSVREPG